MGYTIRSNPEISSERYYIIILLLTSYQIWYGNSPKSLIFSVYVENIVDNITKET